MTDGVFGHAETQGHAGATRSIGNENTLFYLLKPLAFSVGEFQILARPALSNAQVWYVKHVVEIINDVLVNVVGLERVVMLAIIVAVANGELVGVVLTDQQVYSMEMLGWVIVCDPFFINGR